MKTTLGIIVAYILWTAIWLAGNFGLQSLSFIPKETNIRIDSGSALVALLALSFIASFASGAVARLIGRNCLTTWILAGLLLATGCFVQWQARALMPVWYHVLFLCLLVPACLAGSRSIKAR